MLCGFSGYVHSIVIMQIKKDREQKKMFEAPYSEDEAEGSSGVDKSSFIGRLCLVFQLTYK